MSNTETSHSIEEQVLAAIPLASRHAKKRGGVNLFNLLRYDRVPYGIDRRACEGLSIVGTLKLTNDAVWVLQ
jgi:hypothetical protein